VSVFFGRIDQQIGALTENRVRLLKSLKEIVKTAVRWLQRVQKGLADVRQRGLDWLGWDVHELVALVENRHLVIILRDLEIVLGDQKVAWLQRGQLNGLLVVIFEALGGFFGLVLVDLQT